MARPGARQWGAAGQWSPAGGRGDGGRALPEAGSLRRPRGVRGRDQLSPCSGVAAWGGRLVLEAPAPAPTGAPPAWAETRSRTAPLLPGPGGWTLVPRGGARRGEGAGRGERGRGETAGEDTRRPRGDDG